MQVFAFWEPILDSDTAPPSMPALERLNVPGVRQFWDPDHRLAALLLQTQQAAQLRPRCCVYEGNILWDLIAVFPAGARWESAPPRPILFDGTMVKTAPQLDAVLHP